MDSKVITKIKSTASGSIQLLNASDEIVRIIQPNGLTAHGIREGQSNEGVCIINSGGNQEAVLVTSNITDYEAYPAANTPFAGTTEDLKALLAESFFFSVSGGGIASGLELVAGSLIFSGSEATAVLAGSPANDIVPSVTDYYELRLTSAGAITLTGILKPPTNRKQEILLINDNNPVGGATITMAKLNAGSLAANQLCFPPATIAVQAGGRRSLWYDNVPALGGWRWCSFF